MRFWFIRGKAVPKAHGTTHNPGGSDAVTTNTPITLAFSDSPTEGTATKLARSDHKHGMPADPGGAGEGHITVIPFAYSSIGQGTWANFYDYGQYWDSIFYNSSLADGDNILYKVFLAAGTYTFHFLYTKSPTRAILQVKLNTTQIANVDMYGVLAYNVVSNTTGIVVSTSGLYTLTFKVNGRNASSTGWIVNWTYFVLYRTA